MKYSKPRSLIHVVIVLSFLAVIVGADGIAPVAFNIERTVLTQGYDGTMCWVHARAGAIPSKDETVPPTVVTTSQPLMLTGSDVFYALNSSVSHDLGKTWSPLTPQPGFERRKIAERTEETISDFTPAWHQSSGKLLGTGHTVRYFDNRVMGVRPRFTAYSVYDPISDAWGKPKTLKMPDESRFENCGAGSVQRYDLPERGARLGNFGIAHITPNETWVVAAEWMQSQGVIPVDNKYGADNSIHIAKIKWKASAGDSAGKD